MKSLFVITLLFVLSANLPADSLPESRMGKCRMEVTDIKVSLTLLERVKLDLLNGVWTSEEPEMGQFLQIQFNETGFVDIITFGKNGKVNFETAVWDVEEVQGKAILLWTAKKNQRTIFLRVKQTCIGILLEDVFTQKERLLIFHPLAKSKELGHLITSLTGNWTSATYPFNVNDLDYSIGNTVLMPGAFLDYQIKPNGTYLKSYGNETLQVMESGVWEVSKDGQFVLFHQKQDGKSERKVTHVAKILHLDIDELVLENSLNSSEYHRLFSTARRAFAFIK